MAGGWGCGEVLDMGWKWGVHDLDVKAMPERRRQNNRNTIGLRNWDQEPESAAHVITCIINHSRFSPNCCSHCLGTSHGTASTTSLSRRLAHCLAPSYSLLPLLHEFPTRKSTSASGGLGTKCFSHTNLPHDNSTAAARVASAYFG